jgi:hypothetical protein
MSTILRGNRAEAAVLHALVQRGFAVSGPFSDGHPYDLVAEVQRGEFLRIQCKHARVHCRCIKFNSRSTDHGLGAGDYVGLADFFGVFLPVTDSVYLVPVRDVPRSCVHLRLEPTLNNQTRGVRMAEDYLIDRWTRERLVEVVRLDREAGSRLEAAA